MKYTIQSIELQNGKWQSRYIPPISNGIASEGIEFEKYFNSKKESDDFTFQYLINKGIPKDKIEII